MDRARLSTVVLFGVAVPTGGCGKHRVPMAIDWRTDVDAELARSMRERKPVLVFFRAAWDAAATRLEDVFQHPDVRPLLAEFVLIKVDMTDEERPPKVQAAIERFRVVGEPAIVFLLPDGSELARIDNDVDPDEMTWRLRQTRAIARRPCNLGPNDRKVRL